jgi:hypothetical protein
MNSPKFIKSHPSFEVAAPRLDPAVEPLAAKLAEISRELDEMRALVSGKKEEIKTLFKAATLVSREDAARQLSMSVSQLDRKAAEGEIEETIIDRRPRYSLVDLEQFIAARRTSRRRRLKR